MSVWRRLQGRLFYLVVAIGLVCLRTWAQGPATTTVADTVYRGDGTPAGGVLLISWPAFTTSGGQAVAAGTTSTNLGSGGALSVALVPNTGATPASSYYVAVYQLDDGSVRTEYWLVPATSPATLAQVRAVLGTALQAGQVASQQYVNNAIATKANDAAVVHLAGSETITGTKTFTVAPSVPTPTNANDAVNKAYVDSAAGSGSGGPFVSKAGDTMTGPLTLSGDPVTALQASDRHYVDVALGAKADLSSGVVPSGELGTGTANSGTCLLGNGTWGPCGSSGNAVEIQTVPIATTTPTDNQVLTYVASDGQYEPKPGGGVSAGMQAVKYAVDFNWSQTSATDLSTAGAKTVNLAACPAGVTGTESQYYVYVSGTGPAEAALVTGGTCSGNGAAGTLQFTTVNAHATGYTVSSATGGIQEAVIAARFTPDIRGAQAGKVVVTPGSEINLYGKLSIRSSNVTVDFSGSLVQCLMADTCIYVGDGLTLKFYLSQTPFRASGLTVFNEEYDGVALDATRWSVNDPGSAISVSGGKLRVAGGTGSDGQTIVQCVEKMELGGAVVLQHGDVSFSAASNGVLGGLYAGAVSAAGCLAGFQITPNGAQSNIQALVNGAVSGIPMTTVAGHRYVLTTRLFELEIFRQQQTFHSSAHAAGSGFGGAAVAADVRVVLEVHEIDPTNPATLVEASTVLFDGVIAGSPGFCTYALVNAVNMQCVIAFTRFIEAADTEVRSALPGAAYRTRLVGSLSDGAECNIVSGPGLDFFTAYVPAPNEAIVVRYRGRGRALTRVIDPASIAAKANGSDDGVRGVLRHPKLPAARTSVDCENAALAVLDDANGNAWQGSYETWSDFLPGGATDVFPGDALQVNAPSRQAALTATVREVDITVKNPAGEHSVYRISFADDRAKSLSFGFAEGKLANVPAVTAINNTQVGSAFLADLTEAEITTISTTTLGVDAGSAPVAGGGIEVRWSDAGWGPSNDRNLVGRFSTQTFTVVRLTKSQTIYLRAFDNSFPVRYSRFSSALHVDYPA